MESCFSAPNNTSSFIKVNKSICFIKHDTKLFTTNQLSMKLCKPKYFHNVLPILGILFHLRWKKNLVKHQKVLKYYENDCLHFAFYVIAGNSNC